MSFRVVPAETADLAAVVDCWIALVDGQRAYGSHLEAESNRSVARDLLGQYITGDMLAVARSSEATPGGAILGFVMFYREHGVYEQSRERGVIENVYVDQGARGNGVGSTLLDYAEAELAKRGAEVVGLSAMAENSTTIEWYEDRGYEPHRIVFERVVDD